MQGEIDCIQEDLKSNPEPELTMPKVNLVAACGQRVLNAMIAFALLMCAVPFIILISLLVYVTSGRPIFYRGVRLGRNQKRFIMFKFRTLVEDAESRLGAQLATHRHELMIPCGKMLRDSRLDELPQLLNVIRGDMDIIGPRPERPFVYDNVRHYFGYEKRFQVKPGLLGLSQMFTPHNTPKRLRVMVDNKLIRMKNVIALDILMTLFIPLLAIPVTLGKAGGYLLRYLKGGKARANLRGSDRIRVRKALVECSLNELEPHFSACPTIELLDINEHAFHVRCAEELPEPFPVLFRLTTDGVPAMLHKKHHHKRKMAICKGELIRGRRLENGQYDYVIGYEAVSPLNYYMIHQYFLKESFC